MNDDKSLVPREGQKDIIRAEPLAMRGLQIVDELKLSKCENYTVVWQKCGKNSEIAKRFYVPGYVGFLPFFVWGDELNALMKGDHIELKEEQLLEGILYGLYDFDHKPSLWNRLEDRPTLLHLLNVLQTGFKYESQEKMVLDLASNLRGRNGIRASRIVLEVGRNLIPHSSRIKSDLIMDLWSVVSEDNKAQDLLEEILDLVSQIYLGDLLPGPKEAICYYGLCSLVLLKREGGVQEYLINYIYPNVTIPKLKQKIYELLQNPNSFSPADLRII